MFNITYYLINCLLKIRLKADPLKENKNSKKDYFLFLWNRSGNKIDNSMCCLRNMFLFASLLGVILRRNQYVFKIKSINFNLI